LLAAVAAVAGGLLTVKLALSPRAVVVALAAVLAVRVEAIMTLIGQGLPHLEGQVAVEQKLAAVGIRLLMKAGVLAGAEYFLVLLIIVEVIAAAARAVRLEPRLVAAAVAGVRQEVLAIPISLVLSLAVQRVQQSRVLHEL
jgi:hypothetical protein